MILQIKLLSDLCASSGENYNSYVDSDVVYDDYGFPYIPAKRIKGCIREAALELVEWEAFDRKTYELLFGKEGTESTRFSLDNAYLQEYNNLVEDIQNCKDKALTHRQRVLGLYTYTRTQTAMGVKGVADKGSLRTMRVINKGLEFEATLEENVALSEKERELLKASVSMVKHMGSSRTRGLGLVEMQLLEEKKKPEKSKQNYSLAKQNKIWYKISLQSPLLCKSATGSQEKSLDYIEGSKMIGVLASKLSKEEFTKIMGYKEGNGILVSNAYICEEGKRCTPIRASLQKKKDQTFDEKGEMSVADMLLPNTEEVQWTPVGSLYANTAGTIVSVDTETNYHHRRPDNKAIGKANGKDASAFYQLESIRKGQQFAGFILADKEQAEIVLSCLGQIDDVRMGYGRNAEYGKVEIAVTDVEDVSDTNLCLVKDFVVKLNSPVILYNENGMPSAEVDCLKNYLADALGLEKNELKLNSSFLTYEIIGGFNVTWHRRKPIFTSLGKGTVIYVSANKEVNIASLQNGFIGERVAEGYGEVEVLEPPKEKVVLKKPDRKTGDAVQVEKTDVLGKLRDKKHQEELAYLGIKNANDMLEKHADIFRKPEFKAALSKLIAIVKAETTLSGIQLQIDGMESNSKKDICKKLLNYKVDDKEEIVGIYLNSFLNQIKYRTYKKGEKHE